VGRAAGRMFSVGMDSPSGELLQDISHTLLSFFFAVAGLLPGRQPSLLSRPE
jgi:hypothetical protein